MKCITNKCNLDEDILDKRIDIQADIRAGGQTGGHTDPHWETGKDRERQRERGEYTQIECIQISNIDRS